MSSWEAVLPWMAVTVMVEALTLNAMHSGPHHRLWMPGCSPWPTSVTARRVSDGASAHWLSLRIQRRQDHTGFRRTFAVSPSAASRKLESMVVERLADVIAFAGATLFVAGSWKLTCRWIS